MKKLTVGRYEVRIFLPDEPPEGIIYIPSNGNPGEIINLLPDSDTVLVFIAGFDWNNDLSPWKAKAVFGEEDFGGQADAFLHELIERIIPAAEEEAGISPRWRGIAGYSLAGLYAVYAAYRCGLFSRVASVSGSMWFDEWMKFAENTPFAAPVERAFFSVGAKEKKTRNVRMQPVEENTRAMCRLFEARGAECRFVLNPGNHFVDAGKRIQGALEYLMKP